jgi:hypothetical protein
VVHFKEKIKAAFNNKNWESTTNDSGYIYQLALNIKKKNNQ